MKIIVKTLLLLCISAFMLINTSIAATPKVSQNLLKNKELGFLPNLGQLGDEQGNVLSDIKYYSHQGGVQLYCSTNKISFVFTKTVHTEAAVSEASGGSPDHSSIQNPNQTNHQNDKIYSSRADMMLIGANPNAKIVASEEQAGYENYYLAKPAMKEISNVHTFMTLTYQNIYPHIDLVLHSRAQGIKYEYVVRPGGKVSDIQMQWYGLTSAKLMASGGISYSMRLDNAKIAMEESAPVSFTSGGKVASSFVKLGNRISFQIGKYDHNETLTIDPILNWCTYFGGGIP